LAAISFSNRSAVRHSARRLGTANALTVVPQHASRASAVAYKPTPSASSLELMRGLQVSEEEFMDTIPVEFEDEFFKR